jgi:hypothetical protein
VIDSAPEEDARTEQPFFDAARIAGLNHADLRQNAGFTD